MGAVLAAEARRAGPAAGVGADDLRVSGLANVFYGRSMASAAKKAHDAATRERTSASRRRAVV